MIASTIARKLNNQPIQNFESVEFTFTRCRDRHSPGRIYAHIKVIRNDGTVLACRALTDLVRWDDYTDDEAEHIKESLVNKTFSVELN